MIVEIILIVLALIFFLTPKAIKKIKRKWPSVRTLDDFSGLKNKKRK